MILGLRWAGYVSWTLFLVRVGHGMPRGRYSFAPFIGYIYKEEQTITGLAESAVGSSISLYPSFCWVKIKTLFLL